MMIRNKALEPQQGDLFEVLLKDIVNLNHPRARLAGKVDWNQFEEALAPAFADEEGVRLPTSAGSLD